MEHFITSVHINEVRHLKDIEIKLNPEKRQHLILTGKNGSGKTSVLQAMKDYLQAIDDGVYQELCIRRSYKSNDKLSELEKIVAETFAKYNSGVEVDVSNVVGLDRLYSQGEFVTAYFPADRKTVIHRAKGVQDVKLENQYSLDDTPENILLKYMVHLKTQQAYAKNENDLSVEKKIAEWFSRFENALKVLLSDDSIRLIYDYKNYNFLIEQKGRNPYSLDELSDGYSAIIGIVADLILRMDRNWLLKGELSQYDVEGVVLIDELETHLHVELQRKILPFLTEFFPRIQFIITTHSAYILNSISNACIYDLEKQVRFADFSSYSADEIAAMNDSETMDALSAMWNNFCVTDIYEPGSVVKPIVMAAALEQGKISTSDTFYCDGYQNFGVPGNMTTIKCANIYGHGMETLAEVIANSCNDAMMQIGAKMGVENFLKAQSTFNFGSRTGIDLPNEGYGIMHTVDTMHETELACSAFGQGFSCTMIQEINAMCSVINGGYYYQPHLVTKVKDASGATVKTISPLLQKQTISSSISADIRSYMQASVEQGTSMTSKVQGYSSGGKTGTAEKFPRGNGKYVVSFIGFAPVDDPQVLIYVVIDEPNVEDQASSIYPQYVAQLILSELLQYMIIQLDESTDGTVPERELCEKFNGHVNTISDSQIDENGNLVDEDGNLIDWDGNRIDENGYLLNSDGSYQINANGEYIKSANLDGISDSYTGSAGETLPEAVSDIYFVVLLQLDKVDGVPMKVCSLKA